MARVENLAQLITAYQEAEHTGFKVMLQEWIPGGDSLGVIYNSYFWNGQPMVEFTAQKIRSAPPERGSPCVAVSRYIPAVLESGRAFLAAAKFYGYSCTEFKLDPRDGVYKLIEVNGRHNLSTLLAVKCGINFPWLHYYHLAEGSMPQPTLFRENIYWVDLERELSYIPKRVFHHRERLSQILMPYVCPHIFAVYDSRDIKPFIKRYVDFVRKFVYKLIGWRSRSDHPRPRIVNQNN